jgi:hypothetical protein
MPPNTWLLLGGDAVTGYSCDYPLAVFGGEEHQFLLRLRGLGCVLWVGEPGWPGRGEFTRPVGWQNLARNGNETRIATFDVTRHCICVNTGDPLAVVDVDPRNGGDIEKVRALLLDELKVRIYAEVDTPSGGVHFYIVGHPDLPSVHSTVDNGRLPGFPGVDIQSFGCNVYAPGTRRPKYDGAGYTIVFDDLWQRTWRRPRRRRAARRKVVPGSGTGSLASRGVERDRMPVSRLTSTRC